MATPPKPPITAVPAATLAATTAANPAAPIASAPVTTAPVVTTPIVTPPIVAIPAPTPLSPSNPSISTTSSSVSVTVPNTSGSVTFQLVVTDNLGQVSAPSTLTVSIQGTPLATLTTPSPVVKPGAAISLSGAGSTSTGTITNFTFSLVTPGAPTS